MHDRLPIHILFLFVLFISSSAVTQAEIPQDSPLSVSVQPLSPWGEFHVGLPLFVRASVRNVTDEPVTFGYRRKLYSLESWLVYVGEAGGEMKNVGLGGRSTRTTPAGLSTMTLAPGEEVGWVFALWFHSEYRPSSDPGPRYRLAMPTPGDWRLQAKLVGISLTPEEDLKKIEASGFRRMPKLSSLLSNTAERTLKPTESTELMDFINVMAPLAGGVFGLPREHWPVLEKYTASTDPWVRQLASWLLIRSHMEDQDWQNEMHSRSPEVLAKLEQLNGLAKTLSTDQFVNTPIYYDAIIVQAITLIFKQPHDKLTVEDLDHMAVLVRQVPEWYSSYFAERWRDWLDDEYGVMREAALNRRHAPDQ